MSFASNFMSNFFGIDIHNIEIEPCPEDIPGIELMREYQTRTDLRECRDPRLKNVMMNELIMRLVELDFLNKKDFLEIYDEVGNDG